MNHAQLIALGRSLRVAGEHGRQIEDRGSDANTQEIRQDLERAMAMLDDAVSTPTPTTRCPEHPGGPVDPEAADLCLLCETRRRSGLRTAGAESGEPPERVPSAHRIREDQPQPRKRWIPEQWNGQTWQMCGTPRHSEQEAEQYVGQQYQESGPASACRLLYAFTDHNVVRIWGIPALRTAEL